MKRPNILFYFTDQQRWDTCGCYGQKLDVSPRLDELCERGVRFENAFTCQPVCGPARAALQSGLYPTQMGCFVNGIALPQGIPTLADAFHDAGYLTAYVGKWHLASTDGVDDYQTKPIPPERRGGWRDWWVASDVLEFTSDGYGGHLFNADGSKYEFHKYRAEGVTDAAVEFLRSDRDREKPFILFLSHIEPHHQNNHKRYEGPVGSKEKFADYEAPGDLAGTAGNWRENYPDYLGACNACDENFGRLLDELAATGELENTVVVYTADHGSHFCTRNMEYKRSCHDGCTHIPMVIAGPGFAGGKVCDRVVSLLDLPRTLLACAGIEPWPGMQGRDLHQAADGGDWEDVAFMQISESHVGRAIRTKKWTYEVGAVGRDGWKDAGSAEYMEVFLYDNENDPHQKHNLAGDPAYADVRAQLAEILKREMVRAGEKAPAILPFEQNGYLEEISRTPND